MSLKEKLSNSFTLPELPTLPDAQAIATNVPESITSPVSPTPTVLLSDTKNTIEVITIPQEEQTIINGKYVLESEDDKYFYCTYNTTYTVKVMKDEAKANIRYRDSKGRLLPGYSLVNEAKNDNSTAKKKRKRRFNTRTANKFLKDDLLGFIVELIEDGDINENDRLKAALTLYNFEKPTLSKSTSESVVKIQNNEFDEPDTL